MRPFRLVLFVTLRASSTQELPVSVCDWRTRGRFGLASEPLKPRRVSPFSLSPSMGSSAPGYMHRVASSNKIVKPRARLKELASIVFYLGKYSLACLSKNSAGRASPKVQARWKYRYYDAMEMDLVITFPSLPRAPICLPSSLLARTFKGLG